MFNRNERNGFAVGLTAGICISVIFLTLIDYVNSRTNVPVEQVVKEGVPGSTNNQEQVKFENSFSYWADRLISLEDTSAQWLMTIFSIVASGLLWFTLRATQRMAYDTRRIGEAQTRAYVYIKEGEMVEPVDFEVGKIPFQRIHVRNSGKSPAWDTRTIGFLTLADCQLEDVDINEKIDSELLKDWPAMDMPASPEPISTRVHADFVVDHDVVRSIHYPPSKSLFVVGKVIYRDIFGVVHTTNFSFKNVVKVRADTGETWAQWVRTAKGNESN